jgi:hypothetical protein
MKKLIIVIVGVVFCSSICFGGGIKGGIKRIKEPQKVIRKSPEIKQEEKPEGTINKVSINRDTTNNVITFYVSASFYPIGERSYPPTIYGSIIIEHSDTTRTKKELSFSKWGRHVEVDNSMIPSKATLIGATDFLPTDKIIKITIALYCQYPYRQRYLLDTVTKEE